MKTQSNLYVSEENSPAEMSDFIANYDFDYSFAVGHGNTVLTATKNIDNILDMPRWDLYKALERSDRNILEIADIWNITSGTPGDNYLVGDDFADLIFGLDGNDSLFGGLGNDVIAVHGGIDYVDGGDGNDFILYGQEVPTNPFGEFVGMGINLLAGKTYIVFSGIQPQTVDTLVNIENVGGSIGHDYIVGSHGDNILFGNTGNDDIYGLDGDDRLVGYGGQIGEIDTLSGGSPVIDGAEETISSDGQDVFVLGTERFLFYEGEGHAVVKDYQHGGEDGDIIQLHGSLDSYNFKPAFDDETMTSGDLEIYYHDDLIGIVENNWSVDLKFAGSGESFSVSWEPIVVSAEITSDVYDYHNGYYSGLFLEGTLYPDEAYYKEYDLVTLSAWDLELFEGTGASVAIISSDEYPSLGVGHYSDESYVSIFIGLDMPNASVLNLIFEEPGIDIPLHEWTEVTGTIS